MPFPYKIDLKKKQGGKSQKKKIKREGNVFVEQKHIC